MAASTPNTAAQARRWELREENIDTAPIFTFPRSSGEATLISEGNTQSQGSPSSSGSTISPRPAKGTRRTVKVLLYLRWGALDVRRQEGDEFLHSISLSRATVANDGVNIASVTLPGSNPIRLMFDKNEVYDKWKKDLDASSGWSIGDYYSAVQQIGTGGYGTVFTSIKKGLNSQVPTGYIVAMKRIERLKPENRRFPNFQSELETSQGLRHRNLLRAEDIMVDEDYAYIITEQLDIDLEGLLDVHPTIDDPVTQKYVMMQILGGLHSLHDKGILHLDLKPQNVLCDIPTTGQENNNFRIKICDFGLATTIKDDFIKLRRVIGSRGFRSPEALHQGEYSPVSDIWALGVILYYMQNRDLPFDVSNIAAERKSTLNGISENMLQNCSTETQDLIRSMLAKQPENRPTAEELLANTDESDGSL